MNKYKLPTCITLRVIGDCNLACPFCYGPSHSISSINTNDLLNFISILPDLGVIKVVITGGEPLLVAELDQALASLKKLRIGTLLNTNGILLEEKFDEICSLIDWLALPIDGDTDQSNSLMRRGKVPPLSHTKIRSTILSVRKKYPNIKIRIGTVICAINRNNVITIPDLISSQYKPDIWKLYQFTAASYGLINREKLNIDNEEFEKIAASAKEKADKLEIPTEIYRLSQRDGKYFFLEPNGDAMVVTNGEEKIIGNCFKDLKTVLKACKDILNFQGIREQTITHL